jgi:HEAT repeat protein
MKIVFPLMLMLGAAAYMAWDKLKPAPPPPPPPPPPAILQEPAPVISEEEQAKILKSAEDPDASVRWEAALLLDKMKAPAAMPLIFHMLHKDFEPEIRIKAATLLSDKRGPDVSQALVMSMKDQEAEVRLAALRALEKIGDYSVAGALAVGPVKDQDERVRLQALRTLNVLQDKKQAEIEAARVRYEQEKAAAQQAAQQKR